MHKLCSFRASLFFRDVPAKLLNVVRVAFPWETTVDTPKLTGVPPRVLLIEEIEDLKIKFMALQARIKTDMKDALDERGVGGNEFHTNSILEAIKQIETKMLYIVQFPALPLN